MLRRLRVKNFAIIEDLSVEFSEGLGVLSGETGAGKSIIIDALGVALGQRAYVEMIRTGTEEAVIEAFFDDTGHQVLEELGIDSTDGIILRRHITASGRGGRAFINGVMASVQNLQDVGRSLVDIHGQHEHQSLLKKENQLLILDTFAALELELGEFRSLYAEHREVEARLKSLRTSERERAYRLDMLKHQIAEIEALAPEPGEDQRLKELLGVLQNSGKLRELSETAYDALYQADNSACETLERALYALRETAELDPSSAGQVPLLEEAVALAREAAAAVRDQKEAYEADPLELERVSQRLSSIKDLRRKYGGTIEEVLDFLDNAHMELENLENAGQNIEALEKESIVLQARLGNLASGLTAKRTSAARSMDSEITGLLAGLALKKARFVTSITKGQLTENGADNVEFLFSANPGEDPKALNRVASGGELSRVMLALKSFIRKSEGVPVLIFDEVDSGIGGKTAENVAIRLKELSENHQVLSITHLAQIAAKADHHYRITKEPSKNSRDTTTVSVWQLEETDRLDELARMLSGTVTDISLKHARELIGAKQ